MANNHYEKWILKTLIGIVIIGGGIVFMYYSFGLEDKKFNWLIYALISAVLIIVGILLLSSSAVHKMKSDLIKKQRIKDSSGS